MIDVKNIKIENPAVATVDNSKLLINNPMGNLNLANKTDISFIKSSYILKTTTTAIKNEVEALHNNLKAFLQSFITKDEAKKYTTQDRYNSFMDIALTQNVLDSRLSPYAKTEDVDKMVAIIKQKANSLAAEMSDFGAAAMVGINQGAAALSGAVAPGETD